MGLAMNRAIFASVAALVLFVWPDAALAYVGPGAGISLIGALVGLVAAVFAALGVVLSWPIRKMLKRSKAAKQAAASADMVSPSSDAGAPEVSEKAQSDR